MSMLGPVGQIAQSGLNPAPLGLVDGALMTINTSPYFTASMMLLLNLGGRFLGLELTKGQEKFFMHPYVRRFLIFVVLFVATRNIAIAFWMTIIIILLIGYFLNENSSLCLVPGGVNGSTCAAGAKEGFVSVPGVPSAGNGELTPEEENILKMLLDKKQKADAKISSAANATSQDEKPKRDGKNLLSQYAKNMKLLDIFN
jgi:hypothetical protein